MQDPRRELLNFLLKKKIPLRLAIDILEGALEEILLKKTEKMVAQNYEKR